jgi:hypothetical protein
MSKVSLQSFDMDLNHEKETKFPNPIQTVSVAYDGGKLTVAINGVIVMDTPLAGTDFQVNIT